ncbi:MAG: tRNA dihydrouridine(20/20a) synthase DusA [Neisseria sp.]|nr:tRNA dihydrouridine(20/20a) synthase DusA [Neisseria sp.]
MLDWTDRHYRYMARQITRHTRLYTEMINVNALIHGDTAAFLAHHESEHPVALQLGGSDPAALARCTRMAAQAGYDEVNLNCGCPSPRVQHGAFGACLMREVDLVAGCLNAMQDAADILVTIKHRIGVDKDENYAVVRDFVGTLADKTACRVFIVHARNAWLEGLSPKENRDIPPLRYDFVHRLKQDFPALTVVINGGLSDNAAIAEQLQHVDGVMVGRAAYHQPMLMREWDRLFYGDDHPPIRHEELVEKLYQYAQNQLATHPDVRLRHMARHYLGALHGENGARRWRQMLSDAALLKNNDARLIQAAFAAAQNQAETFAKVCHVDVVRRNSTAESADISLR